MLISLLHWLNEHPERWIPIAGALGSIAADWAKQRWPASARLVDALTHLLPNLPAAYRALRGGAACCKKPHAGRDAS